jgi:trehalose-6-phosphatase
VSPFAVKALAEGVRALMWDPARAAVFCDIDGTLGPVVDRADDAPAPGAVSRLLGALEGLLRAVR